MNPTKSGIKSSEFWITAATLVTSLLVTGGVINTSEGDHVTSAIAQLVNAVVNAASVAYYIKKRSDLKDTQAKLIAQNPDLCTSCGKQIKTEIEENKQSA
jgi:hypothetical protein